MQHHCFVALRSAASILASLAAAPAGAQLASSAAPATSSGSPAAGQPQGQLEEVVVTARRKEERLQNVPVAATVLSASTLDKRQVNAARDLQYIAPSLVIDADSLGGSGAPVFKIRGLTSPLGTDPTVVEYFGDVPVDPRVIASGIYDLSSVQVLRGPQGTLFGKNSTGGAVVFTPHKADPNDFNGFLDAGAGNYSFYQFTGALNVPVVTDKFAVRLSGTLTRQDGFVKNLDGPDADNKNYDAGRLSAVFAPTDNFENDLLASYFHGNQQMKAPVATAIGFFSFLPGYQAAFNKQLAIGPREIDAPGDQTMDNNTSYLISNITRYDLGSDVTLKNILGYYDVAASLHLNQPALALPVIDVAQIRAERQFSDELQLSGKLFNDSLTWILGGFYSRATTHVAQDTNLYGNAFEPEQFTTSDDIYTSKAVFGQFTYDLSSFGLEGLKFTGGLRGSFDHRQATEAPVVVTPLVLDDSELSYTVGLDYQLTDDILLYVTSRHSYKSGGFNLVGGNTPSALFQYAPERLTDVEVGAKATFNVDEMPVRTNLALYRGWYDNVQVAAVGNCPNVASVIVNAGEGSPKGLELEAEARPTDRLKVAGFFDYALGSYDRFVLPKAGNCIFNSPDVTGQSLGGLSKETAGFTIDYTVPLNSDGEDLVFDGNMYYRSPQVGNALLNSFATMPAYAIFNARIDYENVAGKPINIGLYVKNLADKLYPVHVNNVLNLAGYNSYTYGDPRTFGVEIRYEFGEETAPVTPSAPYTPPPPQVVAPAVPRSYLVFFDFNKSDLTPQATRIVDQAAANAGPAHVTQLTVTGHTDTVGSDAYNMRLSRRRAESVAAELEKDGIPSSEIEIVAKGKHDLLVPTADGVKEPQNRRVQIVYDNGATS